MNEVLRASVRGSVDGVVRQPAVRAARVRPVPHRLFVPRRLFVPGSLAAGAFAMLAFVGCASTEDGERELSVARAIERLDAALRDGDDGEARSAAAEIRQLGARGSAREHADEAARLLDTRVEPRLEPALLALGAALSDDDVMLAKAVLARLFAMQPTGAALDLARAYERIIDGREALQGLDLRMECVWSADPGKPGAGTCLVRLAARSKDGVARQLVPGPATVVFTAFTIDARGLSSQGAETRSFDELARVEIPAAGVGTVDLAAVLLELPADARALRLTAQLRLRSGSVRVGERALPAQRIDVRDGELVLLTGSLLGLGPAAPGELQAAALEPDARAEDLLEIALRVRREDRDLVLDDLAPLATDLAEVARAEKLAPALRWLAPDARGGADGAAWANWLEERAQGRRVDQRRGEPVLPRSLRPNFAGP